MKKDFWMFASILLLVLIVVSKESCSAQGMYHTITPVFSGTKAEGKSITVSISSGKKYGLIYPKAGDTYKIGTYIPVNPSPATAGEKSYANYYLVDNEGSARLVYVQGGLRCGNDLNRVEFPENAIWGIKLDRVWNGELIPTGEYSLLITKGNHGQTQARAITGDIIARSEKFKLVNASQNTKSARIFGTITVPAFDSRLKLPPKAREEFFSRMLPIYLKSQDPDLEQVKIHANKNGSFDALITAGAYTLQGGQGESNIDIHSFFFDHHLSFSPSKEYKITFKPGDAYQVNFTLRDDNAGANFRDGYMDYTIQAGPITKK